MRKFTLIMSFVFLIPFAGFSQPSGDVYNLDYGLKLGAANYIGDIGGYSTSERPFVLDMKMQETRWSLGAYIRYRLGKLKEARNPWSIEAQLNWIRITGADSLTTNYAPRKLRNLNFRNDIIQFNALADWTFFENRDVGGDHLYERTLSAYLCSGFSLFYQDPSAYNPYHDFNLPTWVSLHGLRTEAQLYNKPFHLIQPGIPFGVGINYTFQRQYRIGWSFTWTKTFTDYLDGISGNYPSQAEWNTLTSQEKYFSNRIESLAGVDPEGGGPRGNLGGDDSFITTTFNIGYAIHYQHHRHSLGRAGHRAKY